MHYHPEVTRALAAERQRDLLADASAWRRSRTRKAARKAVRRFPSLRTRAAPPQPAPARQPSAGSGGATSRKAA
jgi:hypothetical protein